jgi:CRP-like cAMP-binding protein
MSVLAPSNPIRNQLLSPLPPEILASLVPNLRRVSLAVHDCLVNPNKAIDAVYFVESGWVSLVATLEDGAQAEVGLIGREGIVGLPLIVGVDTGFEEAFVRAPGTALQMAAGAFRRTLDEFPILQARLYRYSEAMHAQVTQMVACNGRHSLEQRLARWLLMAHDRSETDDLPVTQEALAVVLCVYRPSVTTCRLATAGRDDSVQSGPHHCPRPERLGSDGLRLLRGRATSIFQLARSQS